MEELQTKNESCAMLCVISSSLSKINHQICLQNHHKLFVVSVSVYAVSALLIIILGCQRSKTKKEIWQEAHRWSSLKWLLKILKDQTGNSKWLLCTGAAEPHHCLSWALPLASPMQVLNKNLKWPTIVKQHLEYFNHI